MTDDRVYEVDVAASPAEAWEALTDAHTVSRYYYGTSPRTTWEVGSPIEFVDGDGDPQIVGEVLEFDPPSRLAHTFIATWYGQRDDQGSLHWEVAPTAEGCRITLIHCGARAESREGSETADGSREIIEALKALLEREPDIARSVLIAAPLDEVWAAISDSGEFGSWFGAEFDGPFEAGRTTTGRIVPTVVDPAMAAAQEPHRGAPVDLEIVTIDPMRRFAFHWQPAEGSDARTMVAFELRPESDGVRVTITEDGFDALPEAERDAARDSNAGGWDAQARLLAAYLGRAA